MKDDVVAHEDMRWNGVQHRTQEYLAHITTCMCVCAWLLVLDLGWFYSASSMRYHAAVKHEYLTQIHYTDSMPTCPCCTSGRDQYLPYFNVFIMTRQYVDVQCPVVRSNRSAVDAPMVIHVVSRLRLYTFEQPNVHERWCCGSWRYEVKWGSTSHSRVFSSYNDVYVCVCVAACTWLRLVL